MASQVLVSQAVLGALLLICLPVGTKSQTNFIDGTSKPLYCYQCNSGLDKDCATLQKNNTNSVHYKPCDKYSEYRGHKPFCRKIIQTIFERENMVRVIRKCGWERHTRLDCYYMSNDDHLETVCQCFHDGCNSAPRLTLTLSSLLSIIVSFLLAS